MASGIDDDDDNTQKGTMKLRNRKHYEPESKSFQF